MPADPKKYVPTAGLVVTLLTLFGGFVAGWVKLDARIDAERVQNNAQDRLILEDRQRIDAAAKAFAERGEALAEMRADVRNIKATVDRIERNLGRQANGGD